MSLYFVNLKYTNLKKWFQFKSSNRSDTIIVYTLYIIFAKNICIFFKLIFISLQQIKALILFKTIIKKS